MTTAAGFAPLLRAEWTKFRTVRGWVAGMAVAAAVMVLLGLVVPAGDQFGCPPGPGCPPVHPTGPGGEAVTDSFSFVRQPLGASGSITAAVTSLTGMSPGNAAAGNPGAARAHPAGGPAAGTMLRRSAVAITAVVTSIVIPYVLAVAMVLPVGAATWLPRVTPAAGFAIQQSIPRYPQASGVCTPSGGCFPLAPWTGFAVLGGYAALALAFAALRLRRADA